MEQIVTLLKKLQIREKYTTIWHIQGEICICHQTQNYRAFSWSFGRRMWKRLYFITDLGLIRHLSNQHHSQYSWSTGISLFVHVGNKILESTSFQWPQDLQVPSFLYELHLHRCHNSWFHRRSYSTSRFIPCSCVIQSNGHVPDKHFGHRPADSAILGWILDPLWQRGLLDASVRSQDSHGLKRFAGVWLHWAKCVRLQRHMIERCRVLKVSVVYFE